MLVLFTYCYWLISTPPIEITDNKIWLWMQIEVL